MNKQLYHNIGCVQSQVVVKLQKVLTIKIETQRKLAQIAKNEINLKKERSLKCLKNPCITGCIKKEHGKKNGFMENWVVLFR